MSNFSGDNGHIIYTEPEDTPFYQGMIMISPEYEGDNVGLCVSAFGGGGSVVLGIEDEDDVQQFLYSAAVQSKLIKDGEPLILMKKVSVGQEDAA